VLRSAGVTPPRHLRDVDGEITAALEVGDHAQACDDPAQITGDGSLPCQQVERAFFGVAVLGVDSSITADDFFGELEVGIEQGRGGPPNGAGYQPGHLQHRLG
jgi:hypothetical protein